MNGEGAARGERQEEGRRRGEEERVRVARRARRQHLRRIVLWRMYWELGGWRRVLRICGEFGLRTVVQWGFGWEGAWQMAVDRWTRQAALALEDEEEEEEEEEEEAPPRA